MQGKREERKKNGTNKKIKQMKEERTEIKREEKSRFEEGEQA